MSWYAWAASWALAALTIAAWEVAASRRVRRAAQGGSVWDRLPARSRRLVDGLARAQGCSRAEVLRRSLDFYQQAERQEVEP